MLTTAGLQISGIITLFWKASRTCHPSFVVKTDFDRVPTTWFDYNLFRQSNNKKSHKHSTYTRIINCLRAHNVNIIDKCIASKHLRFFCYLYICHMAINDKPTVSSVAPTWQNTSVVVHCWVRGWEPRCVCICSIRHRGWPKAVYYYRSSHHQGTHCVYMHPRPINLSSICGFLCARGCETNTNQSTCARSKRYKLLLS